MSSLNNETLTGSIVSMSRSYTNGWRILTVDVSGEDVTVTGCVPGSLQPGDFCRFTGKWQNHQRYGKQFQVSQVVVDKPKDQAGIEIYLAQHFPFIGPVVAGKLVKEFGEDLFSIMEFEPDKLTKINGITPQRAKQINEKYTKILADQKIDIFFSTHGISQAMINRMIAAYKTKESAYYHASMKPYQLIEDVDGIGFKKADTIAKSQGIKLHSPERLNAGITYALTEASQMKGHVYLPREKLVQTARKILEVNSRYVNNQIRVAIENGSVILDQEALYHPDLYRAEKAVARMLTALMKTPQKKTVHSLVETDIKTLDPDQQNGLQMALQSRISIITGGPGTGKTYLIKRIMEAFGRDCSIELAAPTGKAAKRMEEATGRQAQTIHRLLEYHPAFGFQKDNEHPLECDVLITDEVSMIDLPLMDALLDAIDPDKTQVIFVGDVNQLPSVGPGAVLKDMIDSGAIPTTYLKTLHRQAKHSSININAQLINQGEPLDLSSDPDTDFCMIVESRKENIPDLILKVCAKLKDRFGFDSDDIQVLTPQKIGDIGTLALNKKLQPWFNACGLQTKMIGETGLRIGDRVIQTKNNYNLEIFNGDIGKVVDCDSEANPTRITISFNGRMVEYDTADVMDLQLAYALTIHKSQGSEFPAVIIPVHTTNFIMLKRNLLYTGITRGKKMVVLIGTMKAINLAIRTVDTSTRYTMLAKRISDAV